jgi:hypothetical protein
VNLPELDPLAPIPAAVVPVSTDWALSECVAPDGTVTFWLLSAHPDEQPGNASRASAPHEQGGKLSEEWKRRLGLECGALTRAGGHCRSLVPVFGDRCHAHRGTIDGQGELF